MTDVLMKRDTGTQREDSHVMTEAAPGVLLAQTKNAKDYWQLQEAKTEARVRVSMESLQGA